MATETKIEIREIEAWNELYCQYPRQSNQQPCYVELRCQSGIITASYNAEIGNAIPCSVNDGHDQRWAIPCLTADAANEMLAEIAPIAQRVLDGYASEYDGNNHRATFTDDARDAKDEIEQLIEAHRYTYDNSYVIGGMNADDWLSSTPEITAATTDEEIEAMATDYQGIAAADNIVLLGMAKHLELLRQAHRDADENA
jgi:hypothetical protein